MRSIRQMMPNEHNPLYRTRICPGGRGRLMALCILIGVLLGALTLAPAAHAVEPGIESDFFQRLNSERTMRGLPALKMSTSLQGVAQRYSYRLATSSQCKEGGLVHNSNRIQEIRTYVTQNIHDEAENIACGGSVAQVHEGLMNSPGHREHILGPFNFVGCLLYTSPSPRDS